jgi:hypothetical protein
MTVCPIALAVGCRKCPVFKVCPLKSVIGDYHPAEAGPAKQAAASSKPSEGPTRKAAATNRKSRARRRGQRAK